MTVIREPPNPSGSIRAKPAARTSGSAETRSTPPPYMRARAPDRMRCLRIDGEERDVIDIEAGWQRAQVVNRARRQQAGHDERQGQGELRHHEAAPDARRMRSFGRGASAFAERLRRQRP